MVFTEKILLFLSLFDIIFITNENESKKILLFERSDTSE